MPNLDEIKFIPIKFIEKVAQAKDTVTLKFQVPEDFTWREGTHFHMAFKGFEQELPPNPDHVRTYSIMSLEDERYIGITTRIKGSSSDFKKRLVALAPGEEMLMFKVGSRMGLRREDRPILLISMGVGIATYRPLIKTFLDHPDGIKTLININVDAGGDAVYREEFEALEKEGFTNHFVGSRQEMYRDIDTYLQKEDWLYYAVGSDEFVKNMCDYLVGHGIEKSSIVIDKNARKRGNFL